MELCDELFESVKIIIANIIEDYDIKYPLDIYELAGKMEFEVVPYSSFGDLSELLYKRSEDGFSMYHNKKLKWFIYYNEKIEPKERIKFTIAHEIGHILLKTEDEKLANFFAGYLLAPVPLIIDKKFYSKEKVMDFFKVGFRCAKACLNRALKRILHDEPYKEYENYIIESQKKINNDNK